MAETNRNRCTTALWTYYKSGKMPVIPDIKCKSPAEGDLLKGRDPLQIARSLAEAGAPILSVVTEAENFGGSGELFGKIAKDTSLPVLRKDFISTRKQLVESAELGAAGVLLIASMLSKELLRELMEEAFRLGLEPLVETHDETEILAVSKLKGMTFLGINNRNILELEKDGGDVNTTEKLAESAINLSPSIFIVSESSIASPDHVRRARAAGAHAVLVGTAILKAENPVEMYRNLSINLTN